jgi:hypothetical protein
MQEMMDDVVVRVCLLSPFASAAGQPQICADPRRLPADASADAIRRVQADLAAALTDDLEASLGWPVDRSRLRIDVDPTS